MASSPASSLLAELADLAAAPGSRGDLLEALERLARAAARHTRVRHAEILLEDALLRRFLGAGSARVSFEQPEDEVARRVREGGEPVAVGDLAAEEEGLAVLELRQRGVGAYLGVPVPGPRGPAGALLVFHPEARAWDEGERELLAVLAALAARAIEEHRLAADLADADRALRKLGLTDAATGVASERQFEQVFAREWRRATDEGLPIALLMLELDGLQEVAERSGREAAEPLLSRAARALHGALYRVGDLVARLDGLHLAVLLPETDLGGARAIAERLRREVVAALPTVDGAPTRLSVGLAAVDTLPPEGALQGPASLTARARTGLERARAEGGGAVASA